MVPGNSSRYGQTASVNINERSTGVVLESALSASDRLVSWLVLQGGTHCQTDVFGMAAERNSYARRRESKPLCPESLLTPHHAPSILKDCDRSVLRHDEDHNTLFTLHE